MAELGLDEGYVLHLIAKLEQNQSAPEPAPVEAVRPREPIPNSPPRQPGSENVEDEVLGEIAEQEILAGILRTLSRRGSPRRHIPKPAQPEKAHAAAALERLQYFCHREPQDHRPESGNDRPA